MNLNEFDINKPGNICRIFVVVVVLTQDTFYLEKIFIRTWLKMLKYQYINTPIFIWL